MPSRRCLDLPYSKGGGGCASSIHILGLIEDDRGTVAKGFDGKAMTTLGYHNGPGAVKAGERPDPASVDPKAPDYKQQALNQLRSETHAGEDVSIHAARPWAHLFAGVVEQNFIYHVIDHATKWSDRAGLRAPAH